MREQMADEIDKEAAWPDPEAFEKFRDLVTVSTDVLGGTPVIRGTRVPVYDVAASIAAGHSPEQILMAYPSLDTEMLRLTAIYAEANPPHSHPRAPAKLPEGAVIISKRRVAREEGCGKLLIRSRISSAQ